MIRLRFILLGIALITLSILLYLYIINKLRQSREQQARYIFNERNKELKSVITYEGLGNVDKNGDFGNQLFEIAAVIGTAEKYNCVASLPPWKYAKYFTGQLPNISYEKVDVNINENGGSYQPIKISNNGKVYNIRGFRQSDKYFKHYSDQIRALFTPRSEYQERVVKEVPEATHTNAIGIHIRRGDYVTKFKDKHPECTPAYYLNGIKYIIRSCADSSAPIIICSDDLEYCKIILGPLLKDHTVIYSPFYSDPEGQILDFLLLKTCAHQIMSTSSYSWWSAWLKRTDNSIIIAPKPWYYKGEGSYHQTDDIYCDNWILFNPSTGILFRGSVIKNNIDFLHKLYILRCTSTIEQHPVLGRCFVIGMDKDVNYRVKHSLELLKTLGINAAHYRAVDKSIVDPEKYYEAGIISRTNNFFSSISSAIGTIGCLMSHVSIWGEALYQGYDRITVFEDDITSYITAKALEDTLARLFKAVGDDWDIIYLGRCIDKCSKMDRIDEGIYRTYFASCAHACTFSRRGLRKLIEALPFGTGIDTEMGYLATTGVLKSYAIHPSAFQQDIIKYSSNLRSGKWLVGNIQDCISED